MQGYPRVVEIETAGECSTLVLDDASTILLEISLPALDTWLQQNDFPPTSELLARDLIVAIPLPLRMSAAEWVVISDVLQTSDVFHEITDRFPRLLNDIHRTYEELCSLPHLLYGGVGMNLDGNGTATFYTSHPIDFQPDTQKGEGWYFKLLASGDNHLVWTRVNVKSRSVETQTEHRPWHYVTNASGE